MRRHASRGALPWRRDAGGLLSAGLLLAGLLLAACGGEETSSPGTGAGDAAAPGAAAAAPDPREEGLLPVAIPRLESAETGVRQQMEERREELDRLLGALDPGATLADPGAAGPRPGSPEATELAEAYGELAQVFMTYTLSEPARDALGNARRLQPEDLRWTYLLGYVHQLGGEEERAAELLERAVELAPDYPPAHVRLARVRLDQGNLQEAEKHFRRALELDSELAAALEGLGRIATARGDHAEAVQRFRRALEIQPDATSLRYLLGQALRRQGDLEAARQQLARAGDAPVTLPDPVVQRIGGLAQSSQYYIIQGSEAMADERYELAASSFRQALEIQPDSFVARRGLGYSLERLGDLAGAETQLRQAVERATTREERAESLAILGGLLAARQQDEAAVRELTRSLEIQPEQTGVRLQLADTLARLARMEEAVAQYDRLLRTLEEGKPPVRVRRATALINLGRVDEALAEYQRALREAPEEPGLRLRYAEALEFLGRRDEAEEQRRRARELSAGEGEDRVAVLAGEGRLRAGRGDFAGAVERYRQALELAPERYDVRSALAAILGHLGQYEEALTEYRRVLEDQPEHSLARRGEIATLILSGRHGLARVRLNEALRRWSRDLGLALTQARLLAASPDARVRDGALALEVAQRVMRVAPDEPAARDTLAMALAEAGQVGEAAEVQRQVVAQARSEGSPRAAEYAQRLAAYEAGRPWHAEPASVDQLLALGNPAG